MYSNRILIVDDEQTLVFFLHRGLSEAGLNCEVDVVGSGEEALAKLAFEEYQVLITDLKMPGMNGLTLASAARLLNPAIGVVLMTAYGSREVETEAERLMIDGYLTKPFQMERLRDLIEKILQAQTVASLVTASDDNSVEGIDFSRGNCSAKEVNVE